MTKYNNCTSFLFNSHSGLCTPGAYINEKQPLPSSEEGDFFQSFYCDASKNFSVLSYLKTTACLALFGPKTYMEADADCQSKGAYLISVKTLEKYKLMLFNLTGVRNSWIGCDDKESEGRFIWKEDGQVLTKEEYGLFAPGEPNNYRGAEDCVTILNSAVGLFDYNCSYSQYYVCEMPYRV
ncbi:unnamed protein product [Candidula unifasciata]|uniref:C-type lectin domain-containing protein n=1 Tax=Candidula unifasciata TaxID=100452 RepID=A0A8S3ZRF6_9EUPU|nr:unnamed protein product [Candidula unifasciata]